MEAIIGYIELCAITNTKFEIPAIFTLFPQNLRYSATQITVVYIGDPELIISPDKKTHLKQDNKNTDPKIPP